LLYMSEVAQDIITVPSGFETDFASVPRVPVAYWLTAGIARQASVVHDYLYSTGKEKRCTADNIFLEAMQVCGISYWRRYSMYWAVRAFGAANYKNGGTT